MDIDSDVRDSDSHMQCTLYAVDGEYCIPTVHTLYSVHSTLYIVRRTPHTPWIVMKYASETVMTRSN